MVTRETVCMRRLGGGKRAREVQFGRFLNNRKVTIDRLIEGWSEQTGPAAVGRHVLAIQDTTEINFRTTPEHRRGLGEIGKGVGRGHDRGHFGHHGKFPNTDRWGSTEKFAPGKAADFFTVDLNDPSIAGAGEEDLLPAIVFSLSRAAVRETAVGGRLVVEGGGHAAQEEIVARFSALQRRLWGRGH